MTWFAPPFHVLFYHLYIFLNEVFLSFSAFFFLNHVVCLLLNFKSSFVFWITDAYQMYILQIVFLVNDLFSHSLDSVVHRAYIFNFSEIQLISLQIMIFMVSMKSLPYSKSPRFSSTLSKSFCFTHYIKAHDPFPSWVNLCERYKVWIQIFFFCMQMLTCWNNNNLGF